jgi:ABC-2 type transport system ATP-binding protein
MGEALSARGVGCRPLGSFVAVEPLPPRPGAENAGERGPAEQAEAYDALRDLIRDTAAELGLGLLRVQPQTGRLEDVFRDEVPA